MSPNEDHSPTHWRWTQGNRFTLVFVFVCVFVCLCVCSPLVRCVSMGFFVDQLLTELLWPPISQHTDREGSFFSVLFLVQAPKKERECIFVDKVRFDERKEREGERKRKIRNTGRIRVDPSIPIPMEATCNLAIDPISYLIMVSSSTRLFQHSIRFILGSHGVYNSHSITATTHHCVGKVCRPFRDGHDAKQINSLYR